ncbi:GNAT family N-acetyltransferase [Bacillus sp. Bva_UNVM-123]|uniref:GNAT family N-acetyltransferase n=1 Tax=Bacillus sp. Bva_UNVM-123 TaxID=2829798 RepID=UPI00391F315A
MKDVLKLEEIRLDERKNFMEYLLLADESEEIINEYIHEGDMFSILLENLVIGVALFIQESPSIVELKNIALLPEYRGRGFGKDIMNLAFEQYRRKSFQKMIVGTANSSIANLAFYQKAGFRIVGIRKNFFNKYPNPIYEDGIQAIDMIMFEKNL